MLYDGFETHVEIARALILARQHQRNPNPELPVHLPGDYLNFLGEPLPPAADTLTEILDMRVPGEIRLIRQPGRFSTGIIFGLKFTDLLHDEFQTRVTHDALAQRVLNSHLRRTDQGAALVAVLTLLQDASAGMHYSSITPSNEFLTDLRKAFEISIDYLRSLPAALPAHEAVTA